MNEGKLLHEDTFALHGGSLLYQRSFFATEYYKKKHYKNKRRKKSTDRG